MLLHIGRNPEAEAMAGWASVERGRAPKHLLLDALHRSTLITLEYWHSCEAV